MEYENRLHLCELRLSSSYIVVDNDGDGDGDGNNTHIAIALDDDLYLLRIVLLSAARQFKLRQNCETDETDWGNCL